jgi:hypothetical protein
MFLENFCQKILRGFQKTCGMAPFFGHYDG